MLFLNEKDIYKEGNLFVIKKEINGECIEFARFSNLKDAIEQRDELEEYGWPYKKKQQDYLEIEKYIFQ